MTTWVTKVDARNSGSELAITGETHVIGEDITNYIILNELPLLETPTSSVSLTINGSAATEVSGIPTTGQYRVHYSGQLAGTIEFNVGDAGKTVVVGYKGRGSSLFAKHINDLQTKKADIDGSMAFTGPVDATLFKVAGTMVINGSRQLVNTSVPDSALTSNVPLKNGANIFTAQQSIAVGAAATALAVSVTGDANPRFSVDSAGKVLWGSGSGTGDTNLYRAATNYLKTDHNFEALSLYVAGTQVITSGRVLQNVSVDASQLTGTVTSARLTGTYAISVSGNAATATKLATARNINGVSFDGTADVTVTAAASTLTGTALNATVVSSSLTSVGTLTGLTVSGITNLQSTVNVASGANGGVLDLDSTNFYVRAKAGKALTLGANAGTGLTLSSTNAALFSSTLAVLGATVSLGTDTTTTDAAATDVTITAPRSTGTATPAGLVYRATRIGLVSGTTTQTWVNVLRMAADAFRLGQDASGPNTPATDFYISAPLSTGNAAAATIVFQTGHVGSTGSAAHTYDNGLILGDRVATFIGSVTAASFVGPLTGNASTATTLQTPRTINGVSFNGSANITITANTTNTLTFGTYLTGTSFNGSTAVTIGTNATNANTPSTLVARDASGNFSAGTITATLAGNAASATQLASARTINGVSFDGTANITVTAAAGTLTGTTLNSTVVTSSLTSVGTLASLAVTGTITQGANAGSAVSHILNSAASNARAIFFQTAGLNRADLRVDNSAESGSNAGSNILLNTYDDAGTLIGAAISISRASRTVAVTSGLTVGSNITSTISSGRVLQSISATTGELYVMLANTSGQAVVGVEASVAGTTFVGSSAYAMLIGHTKNQPIQFFANNSLVAQMYTNGLYVPLNVFTDAGSGYWMNGNGSFAIGMWNNGGTLAFRAGGTDKMILSAAGTLTVISGGINVASGYIGVGATPSYDVHVVNATNGRIQVEGQAGFGMVYVQGTTSAQLQLNSIAASGKRWSVASNSSGTVTINNETAGTTPLSIAATGIVTANYGLTVASGVTTLAGHAYLYGGTKKFAFFDNVGVQRNYIYSGGPGGLGINNAADNTTLALFTDAGEFILGTDPGSTRAFRVGGGGYFNGVLSVVPTSGTVLHFNDNGGAAIYLLNTAGGAYQTLRIDAAALLLNGVSAGGVVVGTDPGGSDLLRVGGRIRSARITVTETNNYSIFNNANSTGWTAGRFVNTTADFTWGIETSAGGGLFTGSTGNATVIGNISATPIQFFTSNVLRGQILYSGELSWSSSVTATAFYTSSSREVKKDIRPFDGSALDILNDVLVVNYRYRAADQEQKVGFIAEDTHTLLSGRGQKHLDTANSIGLLIKSVQELSAENKALRGEIEALKRRAA